MTTPDKTVHLQVMTARSPLPDAFQLCQNNSNYMYKYTGGNPMGEDPPGSFNFSTQSSQAGTKYVDIDLVSSSGFTISNLQISYDDANAVHDLSDQDLGNGTWRITDNDVHAESGHYKVFVNNGATATNIECDPRWRNN